MHTMCKNYYSISFQIVCGWSKQQRWLKVLKIIYFYKPFFYSYKIQIPILSISLLVDLDVCSLLKQNLRLPSKADNFTLGVSERAEKVLKCLGFICFFSFIVSCFLIFILWYIITNFDAKIVCELDQSLAPKFEVVYQRLKMVLYSTKKP